MRQGRKRRKRAITIIKSPPSIHHLGVPIFNPPEALPESPFHFTFNTIHFIASNPLLPLKLRVIKAPWLRRRWPSIVLSFLSLKVPVVGEIAVAIVAVSHLGLRVGSTIGPELVRSWWPLWTMIALHLHHIIPVRIRVRSWSAVILHRIRNIVIGMSPRQRETEIECR